MKRRNLLLCLATLTFTITPAIGDDEPIQISGVYPHLRMWNTENEAGTGAVVVWQGDLWAVTYAPHRPTGSDDKLYRITPDLTQHIFEGSVGGTPANRMIHRESEQLLIGPYLINAEKNIRVIPQTKMLGRLTGNARHLTDPENKVYYATMEEGLYEVDVKTLEVKTLIKDGHDTKSPGIASQLPGYHGKGLFSGQGRLVYSNNGEKSAEARVDPEAVSGALAQWFGSDDWEMVIREQFTEVTGPGGISGNAHPETDPLWAMGWDARSLLLALLENKEWHFYRLPKGSHSYDGAHGWNTEWPRIREVGENNFLATMHGTFWDFPSTFSRKNSAGIAPRSNYLKVIGDFCLWDDRIVMGCDDSAAGEFLNTRPFKAENGAPRQSNSNLWFVAPEDLDSFGPAIGRGSVWLNEDISAGETSLPYLFSGYDHRLLHLSHGNKEAVTFTLEVDKTGTNEWTSLKEITVNEGESIFHRFEGGDIGAWVRLNADKDTKSTTAHFQYRNQDDRATNNHPIFAGLPPAGQTPALSGVMQSLAYDKLGLVATSTSNPDDYTYYEINSSLEFTAVDDPAAAAKLVKNVRQPEGSISVDEASILLIEDGQRYRLPHHAGYQKEGEASADEGASNLESALSKSLTQNAVVTVSSEHAEYTAEFATDGKISDASRWIGKENEASWIAFDFGKPQSIASIWVASGTNNHPIFAGLPPAGQTPALSGVMQSLAYDKLGLVATSTSNPDDYTYYEINSSLEFTAVDDPAAAAKLVKNVRQPEGSISVDEASILLIEDGQRYRLPHHAGYQKEGEASADEGASNLESALSKSLTQNAVVTVSSEHAEYTAEFATDGKISDASRWIGKENEASWIAFDFGKPQSIASIWVASGWKNEAPFVATQFDVQIEIDGKWVTIENGEIRNNRTVEKEIRLATPVTCQKLRIIAGNTAFFRIYEIAAFDHLPGINTEEINGLGPARICREVATERDLLNVHGTVYELPARNAQGLAKVRPIATHNLEIHDFCSHNGLLFFTGLDSETESDHILRSPDGKAAVWAGVIDDLWKLGKPRGLGGPWKNTSIEAGIPSDPYLMTGYDKKSFQIEANADATIRLEVDVDGTGVWAPYESFKIKKGAVIDGEFPIEFSAYWVRAVSDTSTRATVQFRYE